MNPFGPGPTGPGTPQQPGSGAGGPVRGPGQSPQAPNPFGGAAPGAAPQTGSGSQSGSGQGPFGGPSTPSAPTGSLDPVGPPLGILAAAGLLAIIGIALGGVFWGDALSALGWLLAGPIAIGVLAFFTMRDTLRRTAAVYLRPDWITAGYAVVTVLVAVGVIVGSVGFAMWIGHR